MNERQSYQLLIQATRIGMYALVVALTLMNHLVQDSYFNWSLMKSFYGLASIGLFFHLIPILKLDRFFAHRRWVGASFLLDLGLISSLMVMSGLNQTLFLFMYLVTIILSGLVLQMRGALIVATLASMGFTVASWFGPEVKAMSFLFILIFNNIAFFAVAGLAGYLSDQLNLFQEKIQAQNLSLSVIRRLNEMIVETIPSALLTVNEKSEILQFNPGASQVFHQADLRGQKLFDLTPELGVQAGPLSQLKKGIRCEVKFVVGSDSSLLEVQILPQMSDFEVPTFLVVVEDLTQTRKMEFAIQQAEKMAAVGGLAAGIAHEIRNPLAGISGSIELLQQSFTSDDDRKLAKIILREIDRLNRLISEFLDFAKPEKPPLDKVNLVSILMDVIENAKLSVKPELQSKLQVSLHMPEKILVLGHEDKLKQAFLNIVLNSIQAMEGTPRCQLKISVGREGDQVLVRIQDSGSGMKAETKKRMFEPFHTTKPKGTGLGLAVTHKILQAHDAHIFVESEERVGTEFVISFPLKSFENQRPPPENEVKEDI